MVWVIKEGHGMYVEKGKRLVVRLIEVEFGKGN